MNMNLLNKLKHKLNMIQRESEDDWGAEEYAGELQSIINVIESGASEEKVKAACDSVGVTYET